jgi:hypothetical protein
MPRTHAEDTLNNKHSKFLPILAGILCLALALWAVLWSWSALITIRPANLLSQWQQKPAEFDALVATTLIPRLNNSLLLNPSDANVYLVLATLYQLLAEHEGAAGNELNNQHTQNVNRSQNEITSQEQNQSYLGLAEANYKKAIQHQPTWDYAWAKFALFYSNNNSQKKMTIQSLNQAMLLGPYENATQKIVIPLIFKHWQRVSQIPTSLKQAEDMIKHALKFNTHAHLTLNAAKQFNKLDQLAPLLSQQGHKNRLEKYKKEYKKEYNKELAAQAKATEAKTAHE